MQEKDMGPICPIGRSRVKLDWRHCGNSLGCLALGYLAVVMELPDSLWINCKFEFGVNFLGAPRDETNFFSNRIKSNIECSHAYNYQHLSFVDMCGVAGKCRTL